MPNARRMTKPEYQITRVARFSDPTHGSRVFVFFLCGPILLVFGLVLAPRGEHLLVNGLVHSLGNQFLGKAVGVFETNVFNVMTEIGDDHVPLGNERDHFGFIVAHRVAVPAVEFPLRFAPVFIAEFVAPGDEGQFERALSDLFRVWGTEPLSVLHDLGGPRMMRTHALLVRASTAGASAD